MPGFDGTGPRGQGPMTGRGMGYCAVPIEEGSGYRPAVHPYVAYGQTPRFWGRGFGRGRGFGFGRGFGWGRRFGWGRGFGLGRGRMMYGW